MPWIDSPLSTLQRYLGARFPTIRAAYERSERVLQQLSDVVGSDIPNASSFVVFGSLARKEYTAGSDLDWCLLIDGRAESTHRDVEIHLKRKLDRSGLFEKPTAAGAFGALVFGHDLVHCIGGSDDTNPNLTRRLLLLLESAETRRTTQTPRDRIMRAILQRYFEEEANFPGKKFFPRFFLNDVVRLWRTMAVDYAAKNSQRGDEKWALRNAKLRFSRKLLLVSGLLLTYEPTLFPVSDLIKQSPTRFDVQNPQFSSTEHCFTAAQLTPLELFARASQSSKLGLRKADVRSAFKSYEEFLKIVDSTKQRKQLAKLTYEKAVKAKVFQDVRDLGHEFQRALDRLFVGSDTLLRELTLKYAIF